MISIEEAGTEDEFGKGTVDFTWLFLKTLLAMIVVIALAVIALRFLLPRLTLNRQIKGRTQFKILDRLPLDAKKGIYVVEVEGRRLLLGAGENYVGLITELKGREAEDD
jgi:flagellar biogenesis protein FliO